MRHFFLWSILVLTTVACAQPAGWAGEEYRVEGPTGLPGYVLGAVDGKVRLAKINSATADWMLEEDKKKGMLIQFSSPDSKYNNWYLSYDVTGKSREVFLTKKPGPGSYWQVDPRGGSSGIRANAGKLDDWSLTAGKAAGKLKDDKGKSFVAYRAVLAKHPKPAAVYKFVELSR
jgi:hypothetical protein